jgi:hypothetical protein
VGNCQRGGRVEAAGKENNGFLRHGVANIPRFSYDVRRYLLVPALQFCLSPISTGAS